MFLIFSGLLMIYSASFIFAEERTGDGLTFLKKQLVFFLLGLPCMYLVSRIDYRHWYKLSVMLLFFSIILLVLVYVPGIGMKVGGAKRWISIGFFHFQPGELAKLAVVIFVCRQLFRKKAELQRFMPGVLSPFFLPLPVFFLLIFQPDFGTIVILAITIFLLMFLAGVPKRYLFASLAVFSALAVWLISVSPYRLARFFSYLNPWIDPQGRGFQIIQSLASFSHGEFWGVGLGNGKEKLFFLPEAHNDFIFAVIGEELGFFGVIIVVAAFIYLVFRGLRIAYKCKKNHGDLFGMYLAAGVTLSIGIQAFTNMGVVLGLLPTKGLTLPFLSYGGSSLLVNLFALGILLSVSRGPKKKNILNY